MGLKATFFFFFFASESESESLFVASKLEFEPIGFRVKNRARTSVRC